MAKYLISLIFILGISGCVAIDNTRVSSSELANADLAKTLLDKFFAEYRNYTRGNFEKLVSPDFVPDKSSFMEEVESGFYRGSILEINYYLNQVRRTSNKLIVALRWEKKVQAHSSGQQELYSGNAQLVFIDEGGDWRLYKVTAGSLF